MLSQHIERAWMKHSLSVTVQFVRQLCFYYVFLWMSGDWQEAEWDVHIAMKKFNSGTNCMNIERAYRMFVWYCWADCYFPLCLKTHLSLMSHMCRLTWVSHQSILMAAQAYFDPFWQQQRFMNTVYTSLIWNPRNRPCLQVDSKNEWMLWKM